MKLTSFFLRRSVFVFFTLFLLSLLIFYTASLIPAQQRVSLFISPFAYSHPRPNQPDVVLQIMLKYRLNDPFYIQYLNWLQLVLTTGSLGYSYAYSGWVSQVIWAHFPATLELVMFSAPLAILGGIKLGVYSAKREHERKGREDIVDFLIRAVTAWGYSVPLFLTGLLSLSIFFVNLQWFTPERLGSQAQFFVGFGAWKSYTGFYTIDALLNGQLWIFLDALSHLVLPVATLTISLLPVVVRVTRSSMLGELDRQYAIAAKARGLEKMEVINRVRKNAMGPVLTISSIIFASMLTGIVVTEYTFSLGGVGSLALGAAKSYDFTLLVGISLFFCAIFVAVNTIVDIAYTYIDPRVEL